MSLEFRLPELGENIKQGDVVKVLVKAGDTVKKDQPHIEVETDKASVEVPSTSAGSVASVLVNVALVSSSFLCVFFASSADLSHSVLL